MILPFLFGIDEIQIDVTKELNRISPVLTGSCIEDVNHEIYGGLYAQRIFGESFEEPAPNSNPVGWKAYGGLWSPDGSGIHVSGGPGYQLVREMPDMTDGEVEGDIVIANDFATIAGFTVRVSNVAIGADAFDGYEIALSTKQRQIILGKHVHNFAMLKTAPYPLVPGTKHHLRVKLAGPKIQVFVDRQRNPIIDFIDSVNPLLKGKTALRTWHSDVTFRNIKINGERASTTFDTYGVSGKWTSISEGTGGNFKLTNDAYNGALAQTIDGYGGTGRFGILNRGLNHGGISVKKGHSMPGCVYLKGSKVPVMVALQDIGGSEISQRVKLTPGKNWTRCDFKLTPKVTDDNATFAIYLTGAGTVSVDQVSLMDADEDRYQGLPVRRDVVEAMKDSGINFLRYGGSMVNVPGYRWKSMIGPRDKRPPYVGNWYPASSNGFGIFDFLELCEKASIGAAFAMSAEETPRDAADLADYLFGNANTLWGRRRVQDGHPEQYKVDYIEIGNEEAIGNMTPESLLHYAKRFQLLARAIHAKAPKIKLVCAAWWMPDMPATEKVFHMIDGEAAAWDIHVGGDDPNSGTDVAKTIQVVKDRFVKWNPKSKMKAVIFEENGGRHDMQRALGHATNVNAARRFGDFVLADCAANCLQPYRQNDNGWDQGQIFLDPSRVWLMPPAFANQMLTQAHQPIRIRANGPKELDILAAKSEDGKTILVTVVNVTDQSAKSTIDLGKMKPSKAISTILFGHLDQFNMPDQMAIIPTTKPFELSSMIETFAPHSVTTIKFEI